MKFINFEISDPHTTGTFACFISVRSNLSHSWRARYILPTWTLNYLRKIVFRFWFFWLLEKIWLHWSQKLFPILTILQVILFQATHALCEKSLLPLDLRCLLRSESNILVASTLTGITIPSLDDSDDFEDANSTSMGIDSNEDVGTSIQPLIDLQLASTKYEGGVGVDQEYLNSEGPTDKDLSKLMGIILFPFTCVFRTQTIYTIWESISSYLCLSEKYGNRANISITELNTIADTIRFEKEKREIEIGGKLMMRKDFIKKYLKIILTYIIILLWWEYATFWDWKTYT